MASPTSPRPRLRGFTPIAVVTGLAASVLLSLSLTGSLSAFTAGITNDTDTAGSGTVVMKEIRTSGTGTPTCTSTDGNSINTNAYTSCSSINKYGGRTNMVPGDVETTTVSIENTGTAAIKKFTLTPGTCTQSNNGSPNGNAIDLCAKVNVKIQVAAGGQVIYDGPASAMGSSPRAITVLPTPLSAAKSVIDITVTLDSALGNTYQGLQASQPLTWTFSTDA